jgi:hypothetical protein
MADAMVNSLKELHVRVWDYESILMGYWLHSAIDTLPLWCAVVFQFGAFSAGFTEYYSLTNLAGILRKNLEHTQNSFRMPLRPHLHSGSRRKEISTALTTYFTAFCEQSSVIG